MMDLFKLGGVLLITVIYGCANNNSNTISSDQKSNPSSISDPSILSNRTLVISNVVFSDDAEPSTAVKQECNLLYELSENIKTAAAGQYRSIIDSSVAAPNNADRLAIEVIGLVGRGGGAWSGEKSILIKGTLTQQNRKAIHFKSLRISRGGVWGPYMGTCAILQRCVKELGEDVANWLKSPEDNAKLGDL